jgi:CubicO group peptidase (beta-lactamase class C family)
MALFVAVLSTACSRQGDDTTAEPRPDQNAVSRVENGLLPAVAVEGELGQKANIVDRMGHYGVPGLLVAVIHEGEIAWERAYGVTEAGGEMPVTSQTMFQAASISKPVTAAATLALVQDGSLALDEDINQWLRSWKVPENEFTEGRSITLRGLLSHTAGFSGNDGVGGYEPGTAIPTITQALNGEPPATTPPVRVKSRGGTQGYGGSGYAVLQQLLIDVSEKPFPELMHETVFLPLGMNRSTFAQYPAPADIAKGHHAGGEPVSSGYQVYSGLATAGLWTTASDLATFAVSIQDASAGESQRVLTQEMAQQMVRPHLSECYRCWGLGFEIVGEGSERWFTHDGINPGFDSKLIANVSTGDGAVVMTNGSLSYGLIYEILDSIATEYGWPDYPVKGQTESVPIPQDALDSIPGVYELEPDFPVTVVADGERLFLQIPTQGLTEIYASTPTSFFITAVDWGPMTFVKDDSGQVTAMMIGPPGQQSTHSRLE